MRGNTHIAKPFLKWAGGKGKLLKQLEQLLPKDFTTWHDATYIEPFVGGGAMFFHILQAHPNISRAVINDVNADLMMCYKVIRDFPQELIRSLFDIQSTYRALKNEDERKAFYLDMRDKFNTKTLTPIENTTLFIFLNRTCFNGLYRVNRSGCFNVPFGKYAEPTICDAETILADSLILQKVEILTGDFEATFDMARGKTLFYFDPPYRPLSATSNFNDYAKEAFDDAEQLRLKLFCDRVDGAGYSFMLSNSDCLNMSNDDRFFDDLYSSYDIQRVVATRCINAVGSKRGLLTEILVRNYAENEYLAKTPKILYQPKQIDYANIYERTV